MDAEKYKKIKTKINKFFLYLDLLLTIICVIMIFPSIQNGCLASFYMFYSLFFIGQTCSHYVILRLPEIDAIKFSVSLKRIIGAVAVIQVAYMLLVCVFWQKNYAHPLYCALCVKYGFSFLIGIVLVFHFLITLALLISFIQTFVSRKYYLIAFGGFDVQSRIIIERQESLRRMALIQPNYSYPIQYSVQSNKYYKFQDIQQDHQGEQICSICLLKKKQDQNFVKTACSHLFHRQCIQKWATINSKCPDCRGQFQQLTKASSSQDQRVQLQEQNL